MLPSIVKSAQRSTLIAAAGRASRRLAARRAERRGEGADGVRIGFVVDATGSREETWEHAQTVQARMFRSVDALKKFRMQLRLVHFGGGRITDHNWTDDPRALARTMAGVRCRTGCTQIVPAIRRFLSEKAGQQAHALILIGDAFEEDLQEAKAAAKQLSGTKIFSFLEGDDWAACEAFRMLADVTGGRFARFGEELPLADLCEGVALLTAGGSGAAAQIANPKVQLLLAGPHRQ